jgi:hypothetical protein
MIGLQPIYLTLIEFFLSNVKPDATEKVAKKYYLKEKLNQVNDALGEVI